MGGGEVGVLVLGLCVFEEDGGVVGCGILECGVGYVWFEWV